MEAVRTIWLMPLAVGMLMAALSLGCPNTPDTEPLPDSSHNILPDCDEGEQRCVVNLLQRCIGLHFLTITACEEDCDPIEGCTGTTQNVDSFIWISNTGEGTLSKVNTRTAQEIARYYTCSYANYRCDPSRTSVNLHGDAVVTNRGRDFYPDAIPFSSVAKFAAHIDDCIDRNGSGTIDTSGGPSDIKPWGEDECMLWSTDLPFVEDFGGQAHGARATAWDGQEDEETGTSGHVWVGTCDLSDGGGKDVRVYKLDGDTGTVQAEVQIDGVSCAYGGAVDADGGFWFLGLWSQTLTRVDMNTLNWESRPTSCGYGITVDSQGRIWTGGFSFPDMEESCVARYDPHTDTEDIISIPWIPAPDVEAPFLRGIAIGVEKSAGFVWAAETDGVLYQIDEETMEIIATHTIGTELEMIGVAVDFKGYVWTVSKRSMQAYKFHPETHEFLALEIGYSPYTYSDMTGTQLRNAVIVR